jgi:putative membrane protein
VLGSIAEVFPGVPSGIEILYCIITFAAGCAAILLLSYSENKKEMLQNKLERESVENK